MSKKIDECNSNISYFPFKPYIAQEKLMNFLYNSLIELNESKIKILIIESPTGTGKTLMILSTLMKYLNYIYNDNSNKKNINDNNDDNWLNNFGNESNIVNNDNFPNKFNLLMKKLTSNLSFKEKKMISYDDEEEKEYIPSNPNQIIYCSRTHSQISQILNEAKKINNYILGKKNKEQYKIFSFSFLASRKILCLNDKINSYSLTNLNLKCKEINSELSTKCMYYNSSNNIENLCLKEVESEIKDIESLFNLCKETSICPYYLLKKGIKKTDFILLPYNTIINKKIRNKLQLEIKDKIIIFDEAHNIIENILNTSKTELNNEEILSVYYGLILYYEKYSNRLKSSNNLNIKQIIKICNLLLEIFQKIFLLKQNTIKISDFTLDNEINNYNLFKVIKFIDDNDIGNKIIWTYEYYLKQNEKDILDIINKYLNENKFKNNIDKININYFYKININYSPLNKISLFLQGLTNPDEDGIIIVDNEEKKLKFLMLNPQREFYNIINESKLIIFLGGTLKPFDDFYSLMKNKEKILTFEGEHLIEKNSILSIIINKNFYNDNNNFCFNYENLQKNLSNIFENLLFIIKEFFEILEKNFKGKGMVVFFPNYEILNKIKQYNKNNFKKFSLNNIYYENKETNVFLDYNKEITEHKKNSILFAVMGGKLSEGINFNDDLCRILFIVGMPYANIKSIEIQEKIKFYKKTNKNYYENNCIKNVNQTIGRCIRHKNDYSIIVFAEQRYSNKQILDKIPKWVIKDGINYINNRNDLNSILEKSKNFLNNKNK